MTNTAIARERAIEDDKSPLREPAKTPLGKKLREIRERIVASGTPLLNDAEEHRRCSGLPFAIGIECASHDFLRFLAQVQRYGARLFRDAWRQQVRSITIGLAAMIAGIALAAAPGGAQSRTTGPLQSDDRPAAEAESLYPFMNSVGFPVEWHAHARPVADDQEADPPRRSAPTPAVRGDEGQVRRQTPRMYAEAARPATHLPRSGRNYPEIQRSAPRAVPVVEEDYQEPPLRPRRTAATRSITARSGTTRRTYAPQGRTPVRSQPPVRSAAQQRWSQAHAHTAARPYAFMDSVGFPQPYVPVRSSATVSAARRTARPVTRRTPRSRTAVPQGFVEVQ